MTGRKSIKVIDLGQLALIEATMIEKECSFYTVANKSPDLGQVQQRRS
jgi:hypothetical protein